MKIRSVAAKSNILDTVVDKIYKLIFGWLDNLFDDSMYEKEEKTVPKDQVKKPDETVTVDGEAVSPEDVEIADDGKEVTYTPKDETYDEFSVRIDPVNINGDTSKVMIIVTNNSTKKSSRPQFIDKSDKEAIQKAVEDSKQSVASTMLIQLKKITATSTICLTNVSSNYALPETVSDLTCILADPQIQSDLTDEMCVYRVESDADGFQVDLAEDVQFSTSMYSKALDHAMSAYAKILELSWYTCGTDYKEYKSVCECLMYELQYQVTELGKLCIIHNVPTTFNVNSSISELGVDKWQILKSCAIDYISTLKLLAMNGDADEAAMINNWVRQLNDIVLYQLRSIA